MPQPFVRIIGPVRHAGDPQPDGCFTVIWSGPDGASKDLGWFFPFVDSETAMLCPECHWAVVAGFATREAAEDRRRQWLTADHATAVDDARGFFAVCELRRQARRSGYRLGRKVARRRWTKRMAMSEN